MKNDVSFKKRRAFKSKTKLFYEMLFYFVSIALGSLQTVPLPLLYAKLKDLRLKSYGFLRFYYNGYSKSK